MNTTKKLELMGDFNKTSGYQNHILETNNCQLKKIVKLKTMSISHVGLYSKTVKHH